MLIYDEATGQWIEDGTDVPEMPPQDLDEQLQSVYDRGGLTEIPQEEKEMLAARYRGSSPSLSDEAINNRQRILAELDAFDAAQKPVYVPYKPRQENPDAPLIEGYGEKMAIKRPGQATVNEWGEEVSPEYVADVEAKVSGRERIPQKPPTEEQLSDFDQFNKIMADLAPDIEKAAKTEADELADREQRARLGDPVHQSLMDPKVRTYHEDAIRKVWNNAYQKVKDRETRKHTEFAKMYVKEQKASQKAAAAAEKERVKAEEKSAERQLKRQEKIEDAILKGKIDNLNDMQKEARADLKKIKNNIVGWMTEEDKQKVTELENDIQKIEAAKEKIYGKSGGGKQEQGKGQTAGQATDYKAEAENILRGAGKKVTERNIEYVIKQLQGKR